jgi:hypothetical protein
VNEPIKIDLDAIEAAANAAGGAEWMLIDGESGIEADSRFITSDDRIENNKVPLVEIHYGHPDAGMGEPFQSEQVSAGEFIAAANPAVVLELVRRLRAAETLLASRIEQLPSEAKVVCVFSDITPEHKAQAEEFAEAIKKRCTSGRWTLVAFFPTGADITALNEEQMRQAGWMRADSERLSVPDILPKVRAYMDKHPTGGSLHIVLEDQNVRDSDIQFCIDYAEGKGDAEGAEIGRALLSMSKTQRLKIACSC